MNKDNFIKDLKSLYTKHGVFFAGTHKLTPLSNYKLDSLNVTVSDSMDCGNGVTDRSGQFVSSDATKKPEKRAKAKINSTFTLIDYEKPMGGDAVQSEVDGKYYTNRVSYERHLKENGCHVVTDSRERRAEKREKMREARDAGLKGAEFNWV